MQPTFVQHYRDAARFQPGRFTPVEPGRTERVEVQAKLRQGSWR